MVEPRCCSGLYAIRPSQCGLLRNRCLEKATESQLCYLSEGQPIWPKDVEAEVLRLLMALVKSAI